MEKRTRNPNFTSIEKIELLNIIEKYKAIIENKKSDHVTWAEKEKTWILIWKQFNAASSTGIYRGPEVLRKYFDNLKKTTRKLAAEEKHSLNKTGGGQGMKITDPTHQLTLSIMNNKSVYGLANPHDCDAIIDNNVEDITEECNIVILEQPEQTVITNLEGNVVIPEQPEETVSSNLNWSKYKSEDLNNPLHTKLFNATQDTNNEQNTSQKRTWVKRRRPNLPEKDELSNLYKTIGEIKLKLLNTQLDEIAKKRKREEEEFELRKELLRLEIKIKQAQLQQWQNDSI